MQKWILLALVGAFSAQADIVLELSDNSRALVFDDNGNVYYEKCAPQAKPERGCSGQDRSQLYGANADRYARSVQSFYGVVDRLYGGLHGGKVLEDKIHGLQQHLDHDEFTADELKNAESVLLGFVRLNEKLEQANREILQYLAPGQSATINEEYQGQRFSVINLSFYPIVYYPDRHKIYRFSDAVTFDQSGGACAKFDKSWTNLQSANVIDRDLRARLSVAPITNPGEVTRVWTSGSSAGYYKVTCNNSYQGQYNYYNFPPVVRTYSPEELRRTENNASMSHGGMSLCQYTANGVEVGREYIPAQSTVVDLGAVAPDAADAQEAVEAGEASVSGTAHPVLCQKDYDYKAGDSDAGYLNGEHFADFSIYTLEESLERMAKSVYANRAEFFRQVAKALAQYPLKQSDDIRLGYQTAGARLFVLIAIEPLLHDIQSKFVDNYVLPDYNRAKEQWSKRLGAESLGDIDLAAPSYRLAVALLTYGLKASESYLNTDDKKALQALTPALGKALAAGTSGAKELAAELNRNRALLEHVTASRRVHGFGVMATSIADYLQRKAGN